VTAAGRDRFTEVKKYRVHITHGYLAGYTPLELLEKNVLLLSKMHGGRI